MIVETEKYKFIIPHARTYTKGVIGCPARAVRSPARYQVVHCGYVWFPSSHVLPASFHSSAPLHPARLRLLNFTFPREPGWLHTRMVQGLMCQTLKTLMHTCNQTRSRFVLNQQQRQPNTAKCIVLSWLERA